MQQEHRPLHRRKAFEQDQEGQRELLGGLGVRRRVGGEVVAGAEQRLGQPRPDVGLPPHARGTQVVDGQPGGDRGQVGLGRVDLLRAGAVGAQERLLHDVLGLADAADHAVGDGEQQRSELGVGVTFVHGPPQATGPFPVCRSRPGGT